MAHRYFEGKAHALLYAKYRPIPPKQLIERIVNFLQEKYTSPLDTAFDVGCGSGQSTGFFSKYFKHVHGTDISKEQIHNANDKNTLPNVSFSVSAAEKINAPDSSVQLVGACQAAHWFNLPAFYNEANRALSKNGVLALYGYQFPEFITGNEEKDKLLKQGLDHFYCVDLKDSVLPESIQVYLGNYREDRFQFGITEKQSEIDTNDSNINDDDSCGDKDQKFTPFRDFTREDDFYEDQECTIRDIVNYCYTWSGFQEYVKKNGEDKAEELLKNFESKLLNIMGNSASTDASAASFTKRTKYFLLIGRK